MAKKDVSASPESTNVDSSFDVDTQGMADPAFGLNTNNPGIKTGYGRGVVCSKCGTTYCSCDFREKSGGVMY